MTIQSANINELIGQVVLKLTQLTEEDLPLVIEFVDYLARQQQPISSQQLPVTQIRVEARQRAQKLNQVPRAEIVTRFQQLAEEIRQIAIISLGNSGQ